MKRILLFCVGICVWAWSAAQDYPSKPVRMVVGFPPGGGTAWTVAAGRVSRVPSFPEVPSAVEAGLPGQPAARRNGEGNADT